MATPNRNPPPTAEVKTREGGDVLKFSDLVVATGDQVLAELSAIAFADFNELVEYRRGACRHCHGTEHRFQYRTQVALNLATYAARKAFERSPESLTEEFKFEHGGVGYRRTLEPHPECPECDGLGEEYPVLKDTRKLTPQARRLYAGVKLTKDGIEVKTQSKDKALELLMRHHGLLKDKLEVTGDLAAELIKARKRSGG